jgi:hypothetical protein
VAGPEPECDSLDTRNSVVKIVSGDSNNALVNYAAKNSSAVEARVNNASTEAEKLAIWETARQGASYRLGDAISTNSKSKDKRAVTCSGSLSATVEDATAQKKVDFISCRFDYLDPGQGFRVSIGYAVPTANILEYTYEPPRISAVVVGMPKGITPLTERRLTIRHFYQS